MNLRINILIFLGGEIVGFRNGIVHDYGKTDYTIVYDIISKDLFILKDELEQIKL